MQRSGFSLVELSIVLIILGLLTGGILAGQSLIRASELRAVTTEYKRYTTAIGAFRDKYFGLPGDLNNATSFWGAGTCPGTNVNTTSPQPNTCNGDGDGMIEIAESSATTSNGTFRNWQHLALAGLIEGSYTGVSNSASYNGTEASLTTPNVPASKMSSAGWSLVYPSSISSTATDLGWFYAGNYGHALVFGAVAAGAYTGGPLLKPEEAWNIDTKMDDGKPATGNVVSLYTQNGTASTNCGDKATAVYILSATSNNCTLLMKTGY